MHEFVTWVRKIPWRKKWKLTPVFLPKRSHRQRSLRGYSPWGCSCRVRQDLATKCVCVWACVCVRMCVYMFVHVCACTCVCMHVRVCVCVWAWVYACSVFCVVTQVMNNWINILNIWQPHQCLWQTWQQESGKKLELLWGKLLVMTATF